MKLPFFSIVVPLYNKAPHVVRCLNSVLNQDFTNFEVIIVNDASTDGSMDEVNKYSDPRIRILHRREPGPGGYAARNLGIEKATAEWIAFLDADDEWYPDHLTKAEQQILLHPEIDILSAGWRIRYKDQVTIDSYSKQYAHKGPHHYDITTYLSCPRPIWTSVAVIRRDILIRYNGFDERWKHGADTELWLRLLLFTGKKAWWMSGVDAIYHTDSVNMVSSELLQVESPTVVTIKKFLNDQHPGGVLEDLLKDYVNRHHLKLLKRRARMGRVGWKEETEVFYWGRLRPKYKVLVALLCCLPRPLGECVVKTLSARGERIT